MMRKYNIEENHIDMSTDEEVAEKEKAVKENETEIKVPHSGIYSEKKKWVCKFTINISIAELDDFNVGKYFAMCWPRPKAYCWGKLLKVFSIDIDSDATEVQIQFFKKVQNSTEPSQVKWDWPATEDKGIVDAKLCFVGPCTTNTTNSSHTKSAIAFELEAEVVTKFHGIYRPGVLY